MKWNDITSLHLEISALCNSVCPQCARYPTASYFEHPNISTDDTWSLASVKQNLPVEDLAGINSYLLNGTVGDFITNKDALEIVEYFYNASPGAVIMVNTNGSARTTAWWRKLAQFNPVVNFALDGLEDTHHLYRRQTNWNQILENAQAFMSAGGTANWTMTIFEHNEHQVDACKQMSIELGFSQFSARHTDRDNVPALDKNGQATHWLKPASTSPVKIGRTIPVKELQFKELAIKRGRVLQATAPLFETLPLPDPANNCDSLRLRQIYIGGNWSVSPCCFIGIMSFQKTFDHRYPDFVKQLTNAGLVEADLVANQDRTVKQIVNDGFDWIYNSLGTDQQLVACFRHCHPEKSNFRQSQNSKIQQ